MKTNWPKESEIENFYGRHRIGSDGIPTEQWERDNLVLARVPFPLRLSWNPKHTVTQIRCNKAVRATLQTVLERIWNLYEKDIEKVRAKRVDLYGGCYNFRRKRGGGELSTHAWGIAIDIDPEKNPLGKKWNPAQGMMPRAVVDIFKEAGAEWGGDWLLKPDAMHFQFATTY